MRTELKETDEQLNKLRRNINVKYSIANDFMAQRGHCSSTLS
jgi:hypothetical protein